MYATRGDLRQHITKVHRCGVYANIPAGGLSIRQKNYPSSKGSQRSSMMSSSPSKKSQQRREIIFRCTICRNKFPTNRAIERHHYDVHRIDPFDNEGMKNATMQDEEEIESDQIDQVHQQDEFHERMVNQQGDEDEQMAIIQFRNQHQNAEQSPLIVKIERG